MSESEQLAKDVHEAIGGQDPNMAARALCLGLSTIFLNCFARSDMTEEDFIGHVARNVREAIHFPGNKPVPEESLVWMPPKTNILVVVT